VRGISHAPCGAGEKLEIVSKAYLLLPRVKQIRSRPAEVSTPFFIKLKGGLMQLNSYIYVKVNMWFDVIPRIDNTVNNNEWWGLSQRTCYIVNCVGGRACEY
jgi:hypothetical protein